MNRKMIIAIFALFAFAQCAHTTKLLIKNDANFRIITYPDQGWRTTSVNQGERRIVFEDMDSILTSFTAFEKASGSTTVKKFKLKQQFVDKFNNLQRNKSLLDKELVVEFPEDFDVEVSLRVRR